MCDTGKLTKELQFSTKVSVKDGLRKTIEWFKEEYEKNSALYSDT
jgi:nucleoside-diphosphate-sugar epimerase